MLLGVALEPRELGLLPTAAGAGLLGGWLPSEFMTQMQRNAGKRAAQGVYAAFNSSRWGVF